MGIDKPNIERPKSPESSERIVAAAVRAGADIYTGESHLKALDELFRQREDIPDDAEDGFVTDTGRFVTFEETLRIGKANGQLSIDETVHTLDSGFLKQG